ncbi:MULTISPECIES: hypothetical protein [Sphingobacterium]|uniref:hypothetical protein n=1 Tax=Sphingobacterium TaxID=28453 RepID=UPI001F0938B1|nr:MULTISPECIES: hypothetical protein [unclassified Sphingobacterium]
MHLRKYAYFLMLCVFWTACSKDEASDIPPMGEEGGEEDIVSSHIFKDLGSMDIAVEANGNYWGGSDLALIKDISGKRYSYCHPDVEYFADGLYGYKYWMVFTPYFGQVGSSGNAILYENPTVVVSNDALRWTVPFGLVNPIQRPPMKEDGELDDAQNRRQGYWSDVDWMYHNGTFELYYRGNGVSQKSLERICSNSANNTRKLSEKSAGRNIVRQTSVDGVKWSSVEIAFTSNYPATLFDNHVLSPSFVRVGDDIVSYEVGFNTGKEGYKENDPSFVLQRVSKNGLDFTDFDKSKIIHFVNKPWSSGNKNYSPWHLHACYREGYYFLTLAVGDVKRYTSEELYLAFSRDGVNFNVFPKAIVTSNVYRSCIFPMGESNDKIEFGAVIGLRTGEFKYRKFSIKKQLLRKLVG